MIKDFEIPMLKDFLLKYTFLSITSFLSCYISSFTYYLFLQRKIVQFSDEIDHHDIPFHLRLEAIKFGDIGPHSMKKRLDKRVQN